MVYVAVIDFSRLIPYNLLRRVGIKIKTECNTMELMIGEKLKNYAATETLRRKKLQPISEFHIRQSANGSAETVIPISQCYLLLQIILRYLSTS